MLFKEEGYRSGLAVWPRCTEVLWADMKGMFEMFQFLIANLEPLNHQIHSAYKHSKSSNTIYHDAQSASLRIQPLPPVSIPLVGLCSWSLSRAFGVFSLFTGVFGMFRKIYSPPRSMKGSSTKALCSKVAHVLL